jgi:hypothetical protein
VPSPLSGRVPVASTSLGVRGSISLSSGARTRRSSDPTSIGNDTQTVNGVVLFVLSPTAPIERALLRRSVDMLTGERPCCAHCHRTPLVGERVYFYDEQIVCELCRPRRREHEQRSELVRSPEHKRAVRVRSR